MGIILEQNNKLFNVMVHADVQTLTVKRENFW